MTQSKNPGATARVGLIGRFWRALVGRGAGHQVAKATAPLQMSDIHPHGSCARNWRPPDFSDLFKPETFADEIPDAENKRR